MKRQAAVSRRSVIRGILVVGALAIGGCDAFGSRATYRYRLTVEVDTPSGPRKGSSVIEVTNRALGGLQGERVDARARGEAVAVDLLGGQTLFALLRSEAGNVDAAAGYAPSALMPPNTDPEGGAANWIRRVRAMAVIGRSGELPRWRTPISPEKEPQSQYPLFVTFRDVNDPKTVERVDPDDFAKSFGFGMSLKRVTVQITDDPVTTGLQKRLNEVGIGPNQGLDRTLGMTANPTLAQQLGYDDFVRNQK